MKIIDKFCDRFANKLIWVFIFTYVVIFGYICFLKYHSFSYYDWDFASDITVLWNSVNGKMFYYPFLEQTIFGAHLYLIILFLIPVYAIFQHPLTLLFLQSLFLGLAAYPLYLLAKSQLNKTFALVVSLAYLLYPSLGYINLFETHFEIYGILFLFFALYFFEKEDFSKFMIFIFLGIMCKENVSLIVFMFGIYALLRKRSKKWFLVPSLLGITWFFLAIKVIIPYFAKDATLYPEGFMFTIYYKHLGTSIFSMIKTIIMHPVAVAKYAFSQRRILYLFQLFLPTGFLGFLSPTALLIIVPIFMQNLLSSSPTHSSINFQYVAVLIPFIFYSVIHAFKKLLAYKTIIEYRVVLLVGFLLVSVCSGIYLGAPQLHFVKYLKAYQINDLVKQKERLVKVIPKEASVISTFQFLPKLANRHDLYSMHFVSAGFKMYTKVKYEPPLNLEYALIDFNEPLMINCFFPPEAAVNIRNFLEDGNWRVMRTVDNIVLFKKDYQKGHNLCEVVQNPSIENTINANIDNQIMLLGYDVVKENIAEKGILHLICYWKRTGELRSPLGFFIQFLGADKQNGFVKNCVFGYRVYPPQSLPRDQIIRVHHYILIPSDVKMGIYSMRTGLYFLENGKILSVLDKAKTDDLGRIILGDILIAQGRHP